MKNNLDRFAENQALLAAALEKTRREYRPLDPAWYLYRQVLQRQDLARKFEDDFIELVYVTLCAWNMNSRGAKLAPWEHFRPSICAYREHFTQLAPYRLETIGAGELDRLLDTYIRELFMGLELVAPNKPQLVTASKTLHFYLPHLFVPIDRKYTLTYFYRDTNLPKARDQQYRRFAELMREFRRFAERVPLADKLDAVWNATVPKVIDNLVIGYQKLTHQSAAAVVARS